MIWMRLMKKRAKGSYTVEASLVCSITLLVLGSLILQAFQVHDRTAANTILLEAVEAGRRQEEDKNLSDAEKDGMSQRWILHHMKQYQLDLERETSKIHGTGKADGFSNDISAPVFDPESFLRLIEGLSGAAGGTDGE